MQGWHDATQIILQILGNSSWGGIGVIVSSVLSIIAIFHARQSKMRQPHELQTSKTKQKIKDGFHRALLMKDLDIIDSANLNRYLSQKKINCMTIQSTLSTRRRLKNQPVEKCFSKLITRLCPSSTSLWM